MMDWLQMLLNSYFGKTLITRPNFVDHYNLSIWYNGERIYEEPIFFMLQDSDGVEGVLIFDDRIQYLRTVLKDAYGKKAELPFESTYPTVSATKDLWFYFAEQILPVLEKRDYSLMSVLKVMLTFVAKEEDQVTFMNFVSSDVGSVMKVIDPLFNEYITYCGVSSGYRAAICDSMMAVYCYFSPQLSPGSTRARLYFKASLIQSGKFKHFILNDLAMMAPLESMSYQMQLFINADESCKRELALGLMCFVTIDN